MGKHHLVHRLMVGSSNLQTGCISSDAVNASVDNKVFSRFDRQDRSIVCLWSIPEFLHSGIYYRYIALADFNAAGFYFAFRDFLILFLMCKIKQHRITDKPFEGIISCALTGLQVVVRKLDVCSQMRPYLDFLKNVPDVGTLDSPGVDLFCVEGVYFKRELFFARRKPMAQFYEFSKFQNYASFYKAAFAGNFLETVRNSSWARLSLIF